jgi:hypothetical protein
MIMARLFSAGIETGSSLFDDQKPSPEAISGSSLATGMIQKQRQDATTTRSNERNQIFFVCNNSSESSRTSPQISS